MTVYTNIDEIVKEDARWRRLAIKVSKDEMMADDILNTFYLSYIQMAVKPATINYMYIKQSLVNNYIKLKNKADKNQEYTEMTPVGIEQDHYDYDVADDIHNQNLYDTILEELDNIEWFHAKLFRLVMIDGYSIREIERRTGLSFSTIQISIVNTKKYLKNKYQ